jgi:hypothetical protein
MLRVSSRKVTEKISFDMIYKPKAEDLPQPCLSCCGVCTVSAIAAVSHPR